MFHVSTVNAIYEIQSHMNKAFLKDLDQLYKTCIYIYRTSSQWTDRYESTNKFFFKFFLKGCLRRVDYIARKNQ